MIQRFDVPAASSGKKYYEQCGYPNIYVETKTSEIDENGRTWKYDIVSIEGKTQRDINDILQRIGTGERYAYLIDGYESEIIHIGPLTDCRLYGWASSFSSKRGTTHIIIEPDSLYISRPSNFNDLYAVQRIDIPSSVIQLTQQCCANLDNLEEIRFDNNPKLSIEQYAFYNNYKLTKIIGLDMKNVCLIENNVFSNCISLQNIPIPTNEKVTEIPEAYASESGCIRVTIPSNIKRIRQYAFGYCESLESVYIEEGCERLDDQAFSNCKSLTIVKIPDSVKKIRENTFEGCGMFTVVCNPGSYAEYWANMMKIHVEHSGTL